MRSKIGVMVAMRSEVKLMGICAQELRDYVIRPTLEQLGEWSQAAENLLLGTAIQESGAGSHIKLKGCRGIGIYQITPQQHLQVWDYYIAKFPDLASRVRGLASQHEFLAHPDAELATNLAYATAIAWYIYYQANIKLPAADDIKGLARCWYRNFHPHPTGSCKEFEKNLKQLNTEDRTLAA